MKAITQVGSYNKKKDGFKEFYAKNFERLRTAEKAFRNLVVLLLTDVDGIDTPRIESRVKSRDECIRKYDLKYREKDEGQGLDKPIKDWITDLIGIRVITLYESQIDAVEKRLAKMFKVVGRTNKTEQLKLNEEFGYKGSHLDLRLDSKRAELPEYKPFEAWTFEVQIRSIAMHSWSEIDHKLKYKSSLSTPLKRRITLLAGMFEIIDQEFDAIKTATDKEIEQQDSIVRRPKERLTSFGLLSFFKKHFPEYQFQDFKVEGFWEEQRKLHDFDQMTLGDLEEIFITHAALIKRYADYRKTVFQQELNPFTFLRHILYRHNSSRFPSALFELQRDNFDSWILGLDDLSEKSKDIGMGLEDKVIQYVQMLCDSLSKGKYALLAEIGQFVKAKFPNFSPKEGLSKMLQQSNLFEIVPKERSGIGPKIMVIRNKPKTKRAAKQLKR